MEDTTNINNGNAEIYDIPQNIINLSADEAKCFFMRQESFCNMDLPKYFKFQKLLDAIKKGIETIAYKDIYVQSPQCVQDVNYKFFQNKDGLYSWRPLQIINPVLYVHLVKEITTDTNWKIIVDRFKEFGKNKKIICNSLPFLNYSYQKDRANNILLWWEKIEQESIKLAMDYNYLMITDISDCYSSIYTHSITWAMCGINYAKQKVQEKKGTKGKTREEDKIKESQYKLGDTIDKTIRSMSYQQTNGIPQGSVLMDFIAEIVLGYADCELYKRLQSENNDIDYKILRYRDDYRIFGKTQEDVVKVTKILSEELAKLNLKLNTHKTTLTQNLICDAIKADKLYYITHDYKRLEEYHTPYTLQNHLLQINQLAQEYPNSGSLQRAMDYFFKRICDWKELYLFKESESSDVLISIATNIAYNNPKVYKQYVAIISKILSYENDKNKKKYIIKKIMEKFKHLPNVGYLKIWLQRLIIKEEKQDIFSEKICKYAIGKEKSIWNIDWLKPNIQDIFENNSIIDNNEIKELSEAIEYKEIETFNKY